MSKQTSVSAEIKDRNLYLADQVDQKSINQVVKDIHAICESDRKYGQLMRIYNCEYRPDHIRLYIDSFGGQVYQILGLVDQMHIANTGGTPIDTYVTGCAMSAGFICAISGYRRYATSNSWLLYHQVSSSTWGKVEDQQERLDQSVRLNQQLRQIVTQRTRIPMERLEEVDASRSDWYIPAHEALELGCIDAIV